MITSAQREDYSLSVHRETLHTWRQCNHICRPSIFTESTHKNTNQEINHRKTITKDGRGEKVGSIISRNSLLWTRTIIADIKRREIMGICTYILHIPRSYACFLSLRLFLHPHISTSNISYVF